MELRLHPLDRHYKPEQRERTELFKMLDWNNLAAWHVLLIDDEPDNLEVIAETLHFHGIAVKTAHNGIEGLDMLKSFSPTLILLDLSMPKMDGWQMRQHIKSDPRTQHIPVIALTAHAMAGDKERALQAGFDGYLTKPISIPNFLIDLRASLRPDGIPKISSVIPSNSSVVGSAANAET
jgi:two-component system, cell cycle response regulator DivK